GREFAFRLATIAETPELMAALRDFALGQRGPDQLRMEAANTACAAGLLSEGPTRLWMRGEWQGIQLLGWELHNEATGGHSRQVEDWAREAMEALYEDDGKRAEDLLRKALEQEPNAPDLLNNLASAYHAQDRWEESEALIRQIHERFPDYF